MLNAPTSSIARTRRWQGWRNPTRAPDLGDVAFVSDALGARRGIREDRVVRLRGPWDVLGLLLPTLGRVRVLEGNVDWADGRVVRFTGRGLAQATGTATAEALDARGIARGWQAGCAVTEETFGLVFHSLQFFARGGAPALRVYLTDDSDVLAWSKLVRCFCTPIQPRAPHPR